jgi:DNA-binding NarL/FixJ family response regulator
VNITPPEKPPSRPLARIALVEDKRGIREQWASLIDSFADLKCVCACASAEDALRDIPPANPDVVLMDIFLPRMSGIVCTARLKHAMPGLKIMMLTGVTSGDDLVFRALQAGADGYLLKREPPEVLHSAILEMLTGGAPMTSEIARRVVESFRQTTSPLTEDLPELTPREEQVLDHLSRGFSNKEISNHLDLSIDTIRFHLKRIYEKLHVRSRTEAVAKYVGVHAQSDKRNR